MDAALSINTHYCTDDLRVDYAHVGLYDVQEARLWIARKRLLGTPAIRISHARLLTGGSQESSTADKDKFLCFWYHTPNTGEGYVHGYPIEWEEGHLLIRLDPNWNYQTRQFIPTIETAKIEHNIEQQFKWGRRIFETYASRKPAFPISYHMIGPRAADSMFYVQRIEASPR